MTKDHLSSGKQQAKTKRLLHQNDSFEEKVRRSAHSSNTAAAAKTRSSGLRTPADLTLFLIVALSQLSCLQSTHAISLSEKLHDLVASSSSSSTTNNNNNNNIHQRHRQHLNSPAAAAVILPSSTHAAASAHFRTPAAAAAAAATAVDAYPMFSIEPEPLSEEAASALDHDMSSSWPSEKSNIRSLDEGRVDSDMGLIGFQKRTSHLRNPFLYKNRVIRGQRGWNPEAIPEQLVSRRRGLRKREGGLDGMSLSITDNLDTLRRRLLRELSLRQRAQDRRRLMMKNKDFLVEIGR